MAVDSVEDLEEAKEVDWEVDWVEAKEVDY